MDKCRDKLLLRYYRKVVKEDKSFCMKTRKWKGQGKDDESVSFVKKKATSGRARDPLYYDSNDQLQESHENQPSRQQNCIDTCLTRSEAMEKMVRRAEISHTKKCKSTSPLQTPS